jgi:voltage-gated potassium channel
MDSSNKILFSIFLIFLTLAFGTTGYMLIEGWNLLDSFYMTVTTLATVGYGEVHEMGKPGKLFTITLIIFGVGFFLYVVGLVVQSMVEGQILSVLGRKRLDKKREHLKDHYIVCGYGRIGKVLCRNLRRKPVELIVIDNEPELSTELDEAHVFYVLGDATDEMVLRKAGIKQAKGLIAVLGTDADNVFLVLTARQLNPDLFIMARASSQAVKTKLAAAGADYVESPYEMGAVSMAQRVIRPTVTSFLDFAFTYKRKDIQMEEIPVGFSSKLADVTLQDSGIRQKYNLIIIAIKKTDGSMLFNPSFGTVISGGDTVIAVGEEQNLQNLEKILNV